MDEQRDRARAGADRTGVGDELRERAADAGRRRRVRDRLRRLRDDRARRRRSARAETRQRARAGQARRVAVLRHRRRPGRRLRLRRVPARRLPGAGRGRPAARRRPGARARARARGRSRPGERVHAHVDRATRHATECNHTATHLLHAALRQRARHPRAPGRLVRRPRQAALRLHPRQGAQPRGARRHRGRRSTGGSSRANPVRALTTTLDEAKRLGAMALFGEKYGDVVRMVEVGDGSFSRELCGGTHVRNTAEIGLFKVLSEGSSAANMRRIEAVTGPGGGRAAAQPRPRAEPRPRKVLRVPPERVPEAVAELRARVRELEKRLRGAAPPTDAVDVEQLAAAAVELDGARVLVTAVPVPDGKALLDLADRLKGKLGDAAIVLGEHRRGPRRPGGERGARRWSSAASARARSSSWRRPRSAAAAAAATRSPAPAGAIPTGCRRRSRPRAERSRRRSALTLRRRDKRLDNLRERWRPVQRVRSCACLRSITAGRGAVARSATPPACSHPRSNPYWPRRHAGGSRACARSSPSSGSSEWSSGCRCRCRAATRRRRPRPGVRRAARSRSCRSRSSSTTSASRRGWPSGPGDGRARTRAPRRTCSRAGWPASRGLRMGRRRRRARGGAPRSAGDERGRAAERRPTPDSSGRRADRDEPAPARAGSPAQRHSRRAGRRRQRRADRSRPSRVAAAGAAGSSPCSRWRSPAARSGSWSSCYQPFHGSPHGSVTVTIPPHSTSRADRRSACARRRGLLGLLLRAARDARRRARRPARRHLPPQAGHDLQQGAQGADDGARGPPTTNITIIEGRTRAQINELLKAQGVKGSYFDATRHSPLINFAAYGAPRHTPDLEGFLFPDTYQLVEPISISEARRRPAEDVQARSGPRSTSATRAAGT